MMSRIRITGFVVGLVATTLIASPAHGMRYKAYLQTTHQFYVAQSDGSPVAEGPYVVDFSLWDDSTGGTSLWSESQTIVVSDGLANVQLGAANGIPIDVFSQLDYDTSFTPYLEIEFDGEVLAPRTRLSAVPYARVAERLSGDIMTDDGVLLVMPTIPTGGKFDAVADHMTSVCCGFGAGVDTGAVSLIMRTEDPNGDTRDAHLSTGSHSGTAFDGPMGLTLRSSSGSTTSGQTVHLGIESEESSGGLSWTDGVKSSAVGWYAAPDSSGDSMVTRDVATGRASGRRTYNPITFSKTTWDVTEAVPTKQAGKRLTKAEVISELSSAAFFLEEDEDSAIVMHASSDKRKQSLYFPESFHVGIGLEVNTTSSKLFVGNLDFTSGAVDTGVVLDGSGDMTVAGNATVGGQLDMAGSTGALIVPHMTTSQRNTLSAVNGMIIYNTDSNQFNFFENGAWVSKSNIITR